MRLPSAPDSPNFEETGPIRIATGARDPSYPDRARIDSDVRYLLRPPSTPWITFDKETQQEILTSSRSSVCDAPRGSESDPGLAERRHLPSEARDMPRLFPDAPAAISAANGDPIPPAPVVEPSNVVVSSDIVDPTPRGAQESIFDTTHDHDHEVAPVGTPKHIMLAVGGTLGLATLILAAVFVLSPKNAPAKVAAAAPAPPPPTEAAPPNLDVPTPAPPPTAKAEKNGWAKLTIKGAAKGHRVYLDGKMLLGQGQRSFTVRCGDHTIAVGNKTDAKDVDIPCNAEYVVSK